MIGIRINRFNLIGIPQYLLQPVKVTHKEKLMPKSFAKKLVEKKKRFKKSLTGVVREVDRIRFGGEQKDTTYEGLYGKPPKVKRLGGKKRKKK